MQLWKLDAEVSEWRKSLHFEVDRSESFMQKRTEWSVLMKLRAIKLIWTAILWTESIIRSWWRSSTVKINRRWNSDKSLQQRVKFRGPGLIKTFPYENEQLPYHSSGTSRIQLSINRKSSAGQCGSKTTPQQPQRRQRGEWYQNGQHPKQFGNSWCCCWDFGNRKITSFNRYPH